MIERKAKKPAEQNPWYVIMTLHGEQDGDDIDKKLHEKNRKYWNAWACQNLTDMEKEELSRKIKIRFDDLMEWDLIKKDFYERYNSRNVDVPIPDPKDTIDFSDTEFSKALCVERMLFNGNADFRNVSFCNNTSFISANFRGKADFVGAKFYGKAYFINTKFRKRADFWYAEFNNQVNLIGAIFSEEADFNLVKFADNSDFSYVKFNENAEFVMAKFSGATEFYKTKFNTLEGHTIFERATFNDQVSFGSSEFYGPTLFTETMFKKEAFFNSSEHYVNTDFSRASFEKPAYFINTQFNASGMDTICFNNCLFQRTVNFNRTTFKNKYPDMEGMSMIEGAYFSAKDEYWPKENKINRPATDNGIDVLLEKAKTACSVVRHSLGKNGLPDEEHAFYRREMRLASQIGGWRQRIPYWLFGVFSEFGYSIKRPTFWLLVLWAIPAIVYFLFFLCEYSRLSLAVKDVICYGVMNASGISTANIFLFAGFHNQFFTSDFITSLHPFIKIVGTLQTVFSIPLLFFLGLGMRTRFRLR